MSTAALASQGMTLAVENTTTSPFTYDTIPELSNLSGPDGSAGEIEVTDLSSTSKEYKRGLTDNGSVSGTLLFIPANVQHAQLRADFVSTTEVARNYRITFTDSPQTTWTFSAYVASLPIDNSLDGTTTANLSLRIKGTITEA